MAEGSGTAAAAPPVTSEIPDDPTALIPFVPEPSVGIDAPLAELELNDPILADVPLGDSDATLANGLPVASDASMVTSEGCPALPPITRAD